MSLTHKPFLSCVICQRQVNSLETRIYNQNKSCIPKTDQKDILFLRKAYCQCQDTISTEEQTAKNGQNIAIKTDSK